MVQRRDTLVEVETSYRPHFLEEQGISTVILSELTPFRVRQQVDNFRPRYLSAKESTQSFSLLLTTHKNGKNQQVAGL